MQGTDQKIYVFVGDGEVNEGSILEGAMYAAHHKLKNLMLIVDQHGFQAIGTTDDVLHLGSLKTNLPVLDLRLFVSMDTMKSQ